MSGIIQHETIHFIQKRKQKPHEEKTPNGGDTESYCGKYYVINMINMYNVDTYWF